MILIVVTSPQHRLGDQRKEKILEKLLEIGMDKKKYDQFTKSLEERYLEK
jgi:hypothetical protein